MDIDIKDLAAVVAAGVPFVRSLGLELEADGDAQRVRLPDDATLTNHVGRAHAGALFTAAETASGLAVLALVASRHLRVSPIVVDATNRYRRPASGVVTALPKRTRPDAEVVTALASNRRAEVPTSVDLSDESGEVVARAQFTWLRRDTGGAS